MGKLTYVLRNDRTLARAHVIVDGLDVHASHPKGEHKLISFKTESDKAALTKFQDVIKQHFHPREGWVLDAKKPGVAEYPEFPKPATDEEIAAAAAATRQRRLGYVLDGEMMVLDLKRQRSVGDLEIALERAVGVTDLWVLTTPADNDGAGPRSLFTRLHAAAPKLRALMIDCPFEPLARAAATELPGLAGFLEQRKNLVRLAVTGEMRLTKPLLQESLTTLAVCAGPVDAVTMEQLARRRTPQLMTIELCVSVEGEADADAVAAVPSLLASTLDTLTVIGLPDVAATITQLLESKRPLPAQVELDGSCADGDALLAAVKLWQTRAPKSRLEIGEHVRGLVDEAANAALEAAVEDAFPSPFSPEAHDPRARALWATLA